MFTQDTRRCKTELETALRHLTRGDDPETHAFAIQALRRAYNTIRPWTRRADDQQPYGHLGSKRFRHKNYVPTASAAWGRTHEALELLTEIQCTPVIDRETINDLACTIIEAYELL